MTGPRFGLTWDQANAQAAVIAERSAARRRAELARARIRPHLYDVPGWLRLRWTVENDATGEVLREGRARSQRAALRRRHRAYLRVLDEIARDGA